MLLPEVITSASLKVVMLVHGVVSCVLASSSPMMSCRSVVPRHDLGLSLPKHRLSPRGANNESDRQTDLLFTDELRPSCQYKRTPPRSSHAQT